MRKAAIGLSASALLVGMLASFEGYRELPYQDSVGVGTIYFGHTGSAVHETRPAAPVVRAVQLLSADANRHAREAARCIGEVPLYQHEFDAYASLAFNVGSPAFCGSTLVKKLHATPPDYDGACAELLRWVYAGGKRLLGLERRRQAEHRLCTEGYPS